MTEEKRDEQGRIIVPRDEYIDLQIKEMLGEDNVYFTTMNLGLDRFPTRDQLAENYVNKGGADNFARRYVLG